jgi:hypothetical protein
VNIANLQLEGLYLAVAAVNRALVEKGALTREELDLALRKAEQAALGDDRAEDLSSAERDAMAFAPRLLTLANRSEADSASFSELARAVGQHKPPHADQQ